MTQCASRRHWLLLQVFNTLPTVLVKCNFSTFAKKVNEGKYLI
jgi:hypothetical protein